MAEQASPHTEGALVKSSSSEVQSLEAKVDQLQSRLAYMEDEKTRLITAAKSKNEQVQQTVMFHLLLEDHLSAIMVHAHMMLFTKLWFGQASCRR